MSNKFVVGITLDKVQNYLYEGIKSNSATNQKEEKTLRRVVEASHKISEGFLEKIEKIFGNDCQEKLLWISGKAIFYTNLDWREIRERLKQVFKHYYFESSGQMHVKYTRIEVKNVHKNRKYKNIKDLKLKSINAVVDDFKSKKCMSIVIQENAKTLFSFQTNGIDKTSSKTNNYDYPHFKNDIDKLISNEKKEDDFFRIAVIKADLDGIGDLFSRIEKHEEYTKVSDILRKYVTLCKLHDFLKKAKMFKYIGNCSLSQLISDKDLYPQIRDKKVYEIAEIKLLARLIKEKSELSKAKKKKLHELTEDYKLYDCVKDEKISSFMKEEVIYNLTEYKNINKVKQDSNLEIFPLYMAGDDIFFATSVTHIFDSVDLLKKWLKEINNELLSIKFETKLSLSIGIDVVAHSLPLRYFYEQVEKQLENAKSAKNADASLKISMSGQVFFDFEDGKDKISNDKWDRFKIELELVNQARKPSNENRESAEINSHFFYQLLEKITTPSIKENNQRYVNMVLYHLAPNIVGEIKTMSQIKAVLLQQFLNDAGQLDFYDVRLKLKLENKLRLYLLFSDQRYAVENLNTSFNERYFKRRLFRDATDYVYQMFLTSPIGQMFVGNQNGNYEYKVPLEKSMVYRLKRMNDNEKDHENDFVSRVSLLMERNIEKREESNAGDNKPMESELNKPKFEFEENLLLAAVKESYQDLFDSLLVFHEFWRNNSDWKTAILEKEEKENNGRR